MILKIIELILVIVFVANLYHVAFTGILPKFKNDIKNPNIAKSFKTKAKWGLGFLILVLIMLTWFAVEIIFKYIF